MLLTAQQMDPVDIYHTLTQVIIPRPIAWVLTPNDEHFTSSNLAPFSFFNAVCSDPPILMLSMGNKTDGSLKDSCRNLLERQRCVIHIGAEDQAQAISDTARELPFGESELELAGFEQVPFKGTDMPRLKGVPVAMACRLHQHLEVGNKPQNMLLVEVDKIWVDERACYGDDRGRKRINAELLRPLARLGGSEYAGLGDVFRKVRR
ncbi:flavin reductase family protein [Marinobacterium weihaiense]|uniref:Flavin reductase family protein n=1 Tax=Marinobacterium weihaiense TaxID=2851016 RepID=A0ABS6M7H8_9GAMM|nr:flavin reductase family protein [Marinobacterium weihaiense]MBV0932217.1 flavin reductase family protein [Marinobacterium weihaiense]